MGEDPDAVVCDFTDTLSLESGLNGCDAVVQLVGTSRARARRGETYERVDYGTTVALGQAARKVGAMHMVLLSSLGARPCRVPYLDWKWRTEEWVRHSGLEWTIIQSSLLIGRRWARKGITTVLKLAARTPFVHEWAEDVKPMPVDVLARAMARVVMERGPLGSTLTGRRLWPLGGPVA